MDFYRVPVYFLLACILALCPVHLAASTESSHRELRWEKPLRFFINETEYRESVYFEGALYTDTMPDVPVFNHLVSNNIPLFSHRFTLSGKTFVPATAAEDAILRNAGFFNDSIKLHHARQHARKEEYSVLAFYPIRYNREEDRYEKLRSFTLHAHHAFDPDLHIPLAAGYAGHSVLAQGSWYKVCVEETGIHRLLYDDLVELGINPSAIQKQNIRLFGNGSGMLPECNADFAYDDLHENAIYVSGQASGAFGQNDTILFYGRSPHTWHYEEDTGLFRHQVHLYADQSCYFITTDQGPGRRINAQASAGDAPTHEINSFRDHASHQRDLINLLGSGQLWFGEVFDATTTRQFDFDFPNLEPGAQATVEVYLAARASVQSHFTVSAGNQQQQMYILPINPNDYNGFYVRTVNDVMHFFPEQPNQVTVQLTYNRPAAGTRGYLNYLVVNADRELRFTGAQMPFRQVSHIGPGKVLRYNLANAANVQVWDVTDRFNIKRQALVVQGSNRHFVLPGDELREFVAFDNTSFLQPVLLGQVPNQNLHAMEPKDLLIVAPEEMLPQALRLAEYRSEVNGLTVGVVQTEAVYNEFSSGTPDISAIRNFMKMLYDRAEHASSAPRYLLLFGNGTYDNKDRLGYGGNLIPTYQSYTSLAPRNTYMTDDYYGLLGDHEGQDAHGVLDIGIGRLPVRTPGEAEVLVDKIIRYEQRVPGMAPGEDNLEYTGVISNYADWRNRLVFIADDGDFNTHLNDAETIANRIIQDHPDYNVKKIYLDAYQQVTMAGGARYPEVNRAINESVNQGVLMINYIGHGGPRGLAHQRILTFEDIATWNNKYNMPVLMTATCEFSSFDQPDPEELSAGVRIVLKPEGGTMALYTTTRLAWSGNNMTLNSNFMETVFSEDEEGRRYRMGDLIRIAKRKSSGETTPMQLRNFVLLGDPSQQMAYPEYRVVTTSVPDTLKAYQEVTVTGHVADAQGNRLYDYNGVLFPTIYDKEETFRTLGNNTDSQPKDFGMRHSVLYKGKASIVDGAFSFSFVVPRDIAYDYGAGKISYYMDDGYADGHGHHIDFMIGGTLEDFVPDTGGPVIDLYMNDTTFVSGDYTNENPILLAFVHDESGINMTGSIGHDIVAFLNGAGAEPIRLTNYYQADLDTYKSGRVVYPFRGLEDGPHSLLLRVWDTHNNPATASIDFIVGSSGTIVLEDLMNFPNPFAYDTWFTFKHNQAFTGLDVRIDIYDLQGRLVNTISERVSSAGYRSTPIYWNGLSNDGRPLGNGIYLYRLTMKTPTGERARQTEKLVILR